MNIAQPTPRPDSRLRRWGAAHPALNYLAPAAAWILFVAWASLAPPSELPFFEFQWADKLEHAASYGLLAVLLLRGWTRGEPATLGVCVLLWAASAGWGLYLEFLQRIVGYRTFDLTDAAANATGALAGLVIGSGVAAWGTGIKKNPTDQSDPTDRTDPTEDAAP